MQLSLIKLMTRGIPDCVVEQVLRCECKEEGECQETMCDRGRCS